MAQSLRVVEINRMKQPGQLIFGPDPDLHEHSLVDICQHIGCRCAYHAGLADVVGERQPFRHVLVRIGDNQVGKGKVDRRGVVGGLQGRVDRGWGLSNRDQVLGRRIGHHFLSVVVELGGRTICGRDHPQLVGPLESDFRFCRDGKGMAMAAWALVKVHRREFQRAGGSQAVARRLKDFNRLWLKRWTGLGCRAGFGRDRFGLLL